MIKCERKHLAERCEQRGYTLEEVLACIVSEDGDQITVDADHPAYPREAKPGFAPALQYGHGPGTELKAILRDWLGITPTEGCACNSMAARMDALGPDWCDGEGIAEILGVMREEHAKRWAAGQTKLPWTDFGATQLVRLACRRARAKASA